MWSCSASEVKTRDASKGVMEFSIRVDRAALPTEPSSCAASGAAAVQLATAFRLGSDAETLATVHSVQDWRCGDTSLKTP